jgi:hypothetical protein
LVLVERDLLLLSIVVLIPKSQDRILRTLLLWVVDILVSMGRVPPMLVRTEDVVGVVKMLGLMVLVQPIRVMMGV